MKGPYFIILTFTAFFSGFSITGYVFNGISGALPGIIGLAFQVPFTLWIRWKMK